VHEEDTQRLRDCWDERVSRDSDTSHYAGLRWKISRGSEIVHMRDKCVYHLTGCRTFTCVWDDINVNICVLLGMTEQSWDGEQIKDIDSVQMDAWALHCSAENDKQGSHFTVHVRQGWASCDVTTIRQSCMREEDTQRFRDCWDERESRESVTSHYAGLRWKRSRGKLVSDTEHIKIRAYWKKRAMKDKCQPRVGSVWVKTGYAWSSRIFITWHSDKTYQCMLFCPDECLGPSCEVW
jgi:hypothetical protein